MMGNHFRVTVKDAIVLLQVNYALPLKDVSVSYAKGLFHWLFHYRYLFLEIQTEGVFSLKKS